MYAWMCVERMSWMMECIKKMCAIGAMSCDWWARCVRCRVTDGRDGCNVVWLIATMGAMCAMSCDWLRRWARWVQCRVTDCFTWVGALPLCAIPHYMSHTSLHEPFLNYWYLCNNWCILFEFLSICVCWEMKNVRMGAWWVRWWVRWWVHDGCMMGAMMGAWWVHDGCMMVFLLKLIIDIKSNKRYKYTPHTNV